MKKLNRKVLLGALLSTGLLCAGVTPSVYAGGVAGIVFDPTNWIQNMATAMQTAQSLVKQATMISNQISSLTNQANMLINQATGLANQAKNLIQLPLSIRAQYEADLSNLQTLIDQTQSFATNFATLQTSFQTQYPNFGTTPGTETQADYVSQLKHWASQSEQAIGNAIGDTGANATSVTDATAHLTAIAGNTPTGNLDAIEKGNKLAMVTAKALLQLQDLTGHATAAEDTYLQQQEAQQTVENNADANLLHYTPMTVPAGGPGLPTLPTTGYTYP